MLLKESERIATSTDIIGSLHMAESIFSKYVTNIKKLVIFSDMEENSKSYKFPSEHLDSSRIDEIIEIERDPVQKLPDLDGVTVYVSGAHSKDNDKYFLVRDFWLKFFKSCGAICPESNYSSTIISIN